MEQISHDKITRFLNSKESSSKDFGNMLNRKFARLNEDKGGVLILDDTIEEKTYTDENEIICWHYSHAKGRCVKGVNLLIMLVRYGDIALPIAYEPIRQRCAFLRCCYQKSKKTIINQ